MTPTQDKFLPQVNSCRFLLVKLVSLYADDGPGREDLTQDILLQAWKAWPRYRGEAKFSTWFYRISLNTILTHQRNQRPRPTVLPREELIPNPPDRDPSDAQALNWAIRRLGETDRALITMHLEGYE